MKFENAGNIIENTTKDTESDNIPTSEEFDDLSIKPRKENVVDTNNINLSNFSFTRYRRRLASRLKIEKDKTERKKILIDEKTSNPNEYNAAGNTSIFKRNFDILTKKLDSQEKIDILNKLVTYSYTEEDKKNIILNTYEDLISNLGIESNKNIDNLYKFIEQSLIIRQRLIQGIDDYLSTGEGLPENRELRNHQVNAIMKIREFIQQGFIRGYIVQPTGVGKTVLFSSLAKLSGARTLIIVPKKSLVDQTFKELRLHLPEESMTHIGSVDKSVLKNRDVYHSANGHVVVAVEDSFKKDSLDLSKQDFDIVIWDEAHNSYTPEAQEALGRFPSAIKIGFTATSDFIYSEQKNGFIPVTFENKTLYRDPARSIDKYYGHEIDRIDLMQAIQEKMICNYDLASIKVNLDLSHCGTSNTTEGFDYSQIELQNLMRKNWEMLKSVVMKSFFEGVPNQDGSILEYKDKQIFAVCVGVEEAENLAQSFIDQGIKAACITGNTSDKDRDIIFEQYKRKEIQVLTSVQVLKEGWDCPSAEVCLMLRPTLSRVFYQQVMGRVLRLDPENKDKRALIVDFFDGHDSLDPLSSPLVSGDAIKKQKRNIGPSGDREDKDEDSNNEPINIKLSIEKISKVDEIKFLDDGTLEFKDHVYIPQDQIEKIFRMDIKILKKFIERKDNQLKGVRYKGVLYLEEEFFINMKYSDKIFVDKDYQTLGSLSSEWGLNQEFVRSVCRKNREKIGGFKVNSENFYNRIHIWIAVRDTIGLPTNLTAKEFDQYIKDIEYIKRKKIEEEEKEKESEIRKEEEKFRLVLAEKERIATREKLRWSEEDIKAVLDLKMEYPLIVQEDKETWNIIKNAGFKGLEGEYEHVGVSVEDFIDSRLEFLQNKKNNEERFMREFIESKNNYRLIKLTNDSINGIEEFNKNNILRNINLLENAHINYMTPEMMQDKGQKVIDLIKKIQTKWKMSATVKRQCERLLKELSDVLDKTKP